MADRVTISSGLLKDLYETKGLTTFQIAEKLGCCQATVWKRLKNSGIDPRLPGVRRVDVSRDKLKGMYLRKNMSTWKIARLTGIPRGTIHRKLKDFNIETRDLATANTIYPKKNFDGTKIDKAYLIGFSMGDLRVRKQYKNSKTLCVACGTTIKEQANLIKKLFENYGRIWMKKSKKGKINLEAFLNESFDFISTKEVPDWILENKKTFFSFLSGFTDAEGSIGINGRNQAFYSLGNYDHKLLKKIRRYLVKYKIPCNKLSISYRKGEKIFEKYYCNEDYYGLVITKKSSLLGLIKFIKPYLQHEGKVNNLKLAEKNIIERNEKYG